MGQGDFRELIGNEISKQLEPFLKAIQNRQSLEEVAPGVAEIVNVKQDARSRALRTFLTNLGIDVGISIITVIATVIFTMDITSKEAWVALGLLVAKTTISAPVSYILRLKKAPPVTTSFVIDEARVNQGQNYSGRG